MSDLLTVSQIAERFGEPPQRVAYIISKYRIKPDQRIGIIRLFADRQLIAIKQGLYGMRVHRDHVVSSTPDTFTEKECA